jgi:hypothetical protein
MIRRAKSVPLQIARPLSAKEKEQYEKLFQPLTKPVLVVVAVHPARLQAFKAHAASINSDSINWTVR